MIIIKNGDLFELWEELWHDWIVWTSSLAFYKMIDLQNVCKCYWHFNISYFLREVSVSRQWDVIEGFP